MELSERKKQILRAVIDEYMGTAEPVGSRAISKKNNLELSSATIRNEMADLEEMGFLTQPHTSAGRIPSDAAYRFYVNSMLQKYQVSMETMQRTREELEKQITRLEQLIRKAGIITSALTEYTAFVTMPEMQSEKIQKTEIIPLGGGNVLFIVVTKTGGVKNKMISATLNEEQAATLNGILNRSISGLTVHDITLEKIRSLQNEIEGSMNIEPRLLIKLLNFIYEAIEELDETDIYVDNAKSILKYPEYSDIEKARKMFGFLEDKSNIRRLISENGGKERIDVKIGAENRFEELADCSMVTVNYSMNDKALGKLGVIGPKRMNYAKVIASLDCISNHIDRILYQLYIGESEG